MIEGYSSEGWFCLRRCDHHKAKAWHWAGYGHHVPSGGKAGQWSALQGCPLIQDELGQDEILEGGKKKNSLVLEGVRSGVQISRLSLCQEAGGAHDVETDSELWEQKAQPWGHW